MNTLEQQTFIDRLNNAEDALNELANYADNLANRLVGYADETPEGYASTDAVPASGFLPGVGDAASRMSRKVGAVRSSLNRINQALPVDHSKGIATAGLSGQAGLVGGQISNLGPKW